MEIVSYSVIYVSSAFSCATQGFTVILKFSPNGKTFLLKKGATPFSVRSEGMSLGLGVCIVMLVSKRKRLRKHPVTKTFKISLYFLSSCRWSLCEIIIVCRSLIDLGFEAQKSVYGRL